MKQVFVDIDCENLRSLELDEKQAHHIFDVLRTTPKEKIRIIDVNKKVYLGHVESKPELKIDEEIEVQSNGIDITLCCALIKQDKFEWMLQKACELQVTRIVPFESKNTVVKIDEKKINKKIARWNEILLAACKQCNRIDIPKLEGVVQIQDLKNYKSAINLVAYEKESDPSHHMAHYLKNLNTSITVCIGPEGGFDAKEITLLNKLGYSNCSLGTSILRAETAACYVLSAIEYQSHVEKESI